MDDSYTQVYVDVFVNRICIRAVEIYYTAGQKMIMTGKRLEQREVYFGDWRGGNMHLETGKPSLVRTGVFRGSLGFGISSAIPVRAMLHQ